VTESLIVLAAGGTGGHIFPAEALARALLARGRRVALVTDRRGQAWGDRLPEVPIHRIRVSQIGAGIGGKLRTAIDLAVGFVEAGRLLRRIRPAAVVGFGGYASAPAVMAAGRARIPVLLHEQNAVLGRVNRWLAPRAARIALSFDGVRGLRAEDAARAVVTGNPVRPAIAALRGMGYAMPEAGGPLHLLVLGGSQGARIFAEAIPAALALLPAALKARLSVVQQCRPEDLDACRARYASLGIVAELSSFFDDVPARYARAHLVIARSGASTVAELAMIGRPAVLVPYPHATDDHQTANAAALAASGAAWLMPQGALAPDALAGRLEHLYTRPLDLAAAAGGMAAAARPDAAERLADLAVSLADRDSVPAVSHPPNPETAA
jgi:UDP-N-acetylglucosamine--N-acetylmuramyl-(pentapeptide) pyrophosphoryl-undecaprenol N-acetylglucosamine transferase